MYVVGKFILACSTILYFLDSVSWKLHIYCWFTDCTYYVQNI